MKSKTMKNRIPKKIFDALIDKAIISEAEQDNMDLGHALKHITPDQLESILGENTTIPTSVVDILIEDAILKEAEQDNAEIGHALKNISTAQLESIIGSKKPRVIPFKKVMRERIMWAASIAAIFIGGIPVGSHVAMVARNEGVTIGKCETLYACNISEIPDMSLGSKGAEISVPDITKLSDEQLKSELPSIIKSFNESEELQEVEIYGRILTMSYLRLHDANKAKDVLVETKTRLSSESEYHEDTLEWCNSILSQL